MQLMVRTKGTHFQLRQTVSGIKCSLAYDARMYRNSQIKSNVLQTALSTSIIYWVDFTLRLYIDLAGKSASWKPYNQKGVSKTSSCSLGYKIMSSRISHVSKFWTYLHVSVHENSRKKIQTNTKNLKTWSATVNQNKIS